MSIFLRFLIYSLNTLNGVRNSATSMLKTLNEKTIEKFKKKVGQVVISAA